MARGRNVGFIQGTLRHIAQHRENAREAYLYKKLDVHSQQELIELAENSTAPESQRV